MIEVTGESFEEEVVRSSQPVLIDFWGPQCGPCLALMPKMEETSYISIICGQKIYLDLDTHVHDLAHKTM